MPADPDEVLARAFRGVQRAFGHNASLRLTLCASGRDGVQLVATAQRSVTTGSGAVEVAVGCGTDVAGALAELDRRLRGGEEAAG